jgi:hypothetical protein
MVTSPPASLGLDPFYQKYCSGGGIPVVSSAEVPDAAIRQAARIASAMLKPMPRVRRALVGYHARFGILGVHEDIKSFPEYRNDPRSNLRGGYGSSSEAPLGAVAEENVLCYEDDGSRGESVFVHEMAHTIMNGLAIVRPAVKARVRAAYDAAKEEGKYANLYAITNEDEYWAEGVQAYLGVHQTHDPRDINTKDALRDYDPTLFALVDGIFSAVVLPAVCP